MPRTTIDLDAGVLHELKRRKRRRGQTLGQLASELLASALGEPPQTRERPPFRWCAASLQARVDLDDKQALYRALDEP